MNDEITEQKAILIRPYHPDDAEQVVLCIQELQDYERMLEADRVEGRTIASRYLADLLTSCREKTGAIFVALHDAHMVAGFVSLWLEHEAETYLSTLVDYAYVSDIVVRAAYRGRGIGQSLLARAEEYARQVHAPLLRLNVLARNDLARRSYHRAGFREYEVALLKPLDQKAAREDP